MSPRFTSRSAHRAFLATQAAVPLGFRVATTSLEFVPVEVDRPARMNLSLIALDRPTPDFAAQFTRNAFPGAPVLIGRGRLDAPALKAIVINNKISNVGSPTGLADSEALCTAVAEHLAVPPSAILPSSTGVIGWRLPILPMCAAIPTLVSKLRADSLLSVAEGIMTTDLYPKLRAESLASGRVVGIAKGAGMIEPHLATMLVFLLTDLTVPRQALRDILMRVVDRTFNCISVDGDTSTSDTVVALASGALPAPDLVAFEGALERVCASLADDVVRNGEGVHHVVRVQIRRAPERELARRLGRAIVNSPLVKTAICGNDPNVGRLAAVLGKVLALDPAARGLDPTRVRISMAGHVLMERGAFRLNPAIESELVACLKAAELYDSAAPSAGIYKPPIDFPPHEAVVPIEIDLDAGSAAIDILGADLSHEYISENADYRS